MQIKTPYPPGFRTFFIRLALNARYVWRLFLAMITPPYEGREILAQCYRMGYKSFLLIGFTALLVGSVFTRQSRPSLISFGAESWLPFLMAVAIVRGTGPLVTALICAGKIGSNVGAELSAMNVTEQIDAMEVSGTDPFRYLVVSRVTAITLMLPVLVIYADMLGLFGAFLTTRYYTNISLELFVHQTFSSLSIRDLALTIIKPLVFGFAIGTISTYHGYYSSRATIGVGKAANSSVVASMVSIFILDFLTVQFISLFP
ncbi:MlaE family ABC transporter permease [Catalinimonas alkaloidigena]|uniref:MlaE family ABC transporter permease n=1 Tax=Catalinimonas alkaloidigena TaxID=1075417 RepID=UPI001FDF5578|nr:ABC transporter permease [Catalinimonas alkaloidigena]